MKRVILQAKNKTMASQQKSPQNTTAATSNVECRLLLLPSLHTTLVEFTIIPIVSSNRDISNSLELEAPLELRSMYKLVEDC